VGQRSASVKAQIQVKGVVRAGTEKGSEAGWFDCRRSWQADLRCQIMGVIKSNEIQGVQIERAWGVSSVEVFIQRGSAIDLFFVLHAP
jgi:hypothetical protein